MNLRDRILAADDLAREKVAVPEWPDEEGRPAEFYLRAMTGTERERYEGGLFKDDGTGEINRGRLRALLVACCAVDGEGKPVFTDTDVEALSGKSSAVLIRLAAVAQRLNGLGAEAAEAAAKK